MPSELTRLGLSQVVNGLLNLGKRLDLQQSSYCSAAAPECCTCYSMWMLHAHADMAQPFDFLLNGELVRQPLEEMLLGQGLSTVGMQLTSLHDVPV